MVSLHTRDVSVTSKPSVSFHLHLLTISRAWSVCIGRVSQLQREAIAFDLPDDVRTNHPWQALNDESRNRNIATLFCDDAQFLRHFVILSSTVSDIISMNFAPSERTRMNSGRVRHLYHRMEIWYRKLPECLRLSDQRPPHVFILQLVQPKKIQTLS